MTMLSRFATLGGAPTDPYWTSVSYLLVGNGANGTTTNIKDSSSNNIATTRFGNTVISTAQSKFGTGSSVLFDGNGDYLTYPSNTIYDFGTGDFTIECWVYFSTVQQCAFFQTSNDINAAIGPVWLGYSSGALICGRHGSGTYNVSAAWTPSTGVWYYVAATRASGTTKLYIDNSNVTTSTAQNGITFTQAGAAVGVLTTPSYLNGYLYDVRVTKGIARNITSAPSAPFPTQGP